jgi:hypothetical protein
MTTSFNVTVEHPEGCPGRPAEGEGPRTSPCPRPPKLDPATDILRRMLATPPQPKKAVKVKKKAATNAIQSTLIGTVW